MRAFGLREADVDGLRGGWAVGDGLVGFGEREGAQLRPSDGLRRGGEAKYEGRGKNEEKGGEETQMRE